MLSRSLSLSLWGVTVTISIHKPGRMAGSTFGREDCEDRMIG